MDLFNLFTNPVDRFETELPVPRAAKRWYLTAFLPWVLILQKIGRTELSFKLFKLRYLTIESLENQHGAEYEVYGKPVGGREANISW